MHIVIAGNIGSGKTTLTNMLARHYGWQPHLEPVVENPYLEDYYKDIPRWSFAMEVYFLKQRFKDMLEVKKTDITTVQDRSIYEGVYVFVANNHEMGHLSDRDYTTYMELFENINGILEYPDLLIYLRSSVPHLVANIQKRGRNCEQTIALDYLKGLNNLYEDFVYKKYHGPVLTIEVDDLDYEHKPEDFAGILDRIDAQLFGLFEPLNSRLIDSDL